MYTLFRNLWRQAVYQVATFIADQMGQQRPATMREALALIGRTWLGIAVIIAAILLAISALIFLWYAGTFLLGALIGLSTVAVGGIAIALGLGGSDVGAFVSLLIFLLSGSVAWWMLGFWGRRRLHRHGFTSVSASTIWWKRGAAVALLVAMPVFFLQFTPIAGWFLILVAVGFITMALAIASGKRSLANLVGVILVIAFAISLVPAPTMQWVKGETAEQAPSYRFNPETREPQRKYHTDSVTGEYQETKNLNWNFDPDTGEPLQELTPVAYREVRGKRLENCRFNWRKPEGVAGHNPTMPWTPKGGFPATITHIDKCDFSFTLYPTVDGTSRSIEFTWDRCENPNGGYWRQEHPPSWGTWNLEEKHTGFFSGEVHDEVSGVTAHAEMHCQ